MQYYELIEPLSSVPEKQYHVKLTEKELLLDLNDRLNDYLISDEDDDDDRQFLQMVKLAIENPVYPINKLTLQMIKQAYEFDDQLLVQTIDADSDLDSLTI